MSAIYDYAAELWRAMRDDFEHYREASFAAAHEHTRGVMLSRRGRAAGIDPRDLWAMPESRARRYASEELCEYWDTKGRPTQSAYEAGWLDGHRFGGGVVDD